MIENLKWEIQYGDKTIPVTAENVAESLQRARSIVIKEVATNDHIKGNVKMKVIYDLDIETLELVRRMFLGFAGELARSPQPKMTTVRKRR